MVDKILLQKRSVIETVNDELKNICQIEHSRHQSFANFITNLVAVLAIIFPASLAPSTNSLAELSITCLGWDFLGKNHGHDCIPSGSIKRAP